MEGTGRDGKGRENPLLVSWCWVERKKAHSRPPFPSIFFAHACLSISYLVVQAPPQRCVPPPRPEVRRQVERAGVAAKCISGLDAVARPGGVVCAQGGDLGGHGARRVQGRVREDLGRRRVLGREVKGGRAGSGRGWARLGSGAAACVAEKATSPSRRRRPVGQEVEEGPGGV